jgi:two-component system, sensor histidine kinase and response regulator
MESTDPDRQLQPQDQPGKSLASLPLRARHILGLRPKFVLLFSLILIVVCSSLSGYYVEARRETMTDNLRQLGTILLTSVAHNEHFQYAGIVAEDHTTLQQFIDGLMAVQDVVYVVITRSDGSVLAQHTKGSRQSSSELVRSLNHPLYPESQVVKPVLQSQNTIPLVTGIPLPTKIGNVLALDEIVYDFAMPVLRRAQGSPSSPALSFPLNEGSADSSSIQPAHISAVLQIGLTDAYLKQDLAVMIRDILIFTALIIGVGALVTHLLTLRITGPLRSLASVAQQVAEGRSPPLLTPFSRDEVGQLTNMFNLMTSSLQERNAAISANMATIEHQVGQLTTLHQVSAAIARTLDLKQILHTVLQLLITNLGFTRMLVTLRHRERDTAYVAHIVGVEPDIEEAARRLDVPIRNDGGLQADLLIHGNPLLIPSLDAVAERMNPPMLELARLTGVTSFVAVPLQSQNHTLGYLAGDRGS